MTEPRTPTVLEEAQGPGAWLRRHWLSTLVAVVVLIYGVIWFRESFYDQGYAPEQPIAYSHKLHAGDLKIDCKYCHFNAIRGKHAGVPPMSVCMGCHGPQNGGVNGDKPEIQKLVKIAQDGTYTDEEGVVHDGGVVHWKRVHKLPDFVYFPHQWHVKAGVACQTCHGPIEQMAVVRQYATLTMGWCLECHRRSNYVGGPRFDRDHPYDADPETFTVGTFNYDIQRARIRADAVAEFEARKVQGNDPRDQPAKGEGGEQGQHTPQSVAGGGGPDRAAQGGEVPLGLHGRFVLTEPQRQQLEQVFAKHPEWREKFQRMPDWRVADLPVTHRIYYGVNPDGTANAALDSFNNSPTQCSTCHQ